MTTQSKSKRTIRAVFATYRDVTKSLAGQDREVTRTGFAGDEVELLPSEEERLEALGALEPKDERRSSELQDPTGAISRALNPSDNVGEGGALTRTAPITVSPPSLGVPPEGGLLTGDTGTEDVQPPPGADVDGAAGGGAGEFDARGKDLDEVQEWLRSERPTAPQVVSAAGDDPEAAETLLEAERLVRGGDPRATVEKPLQSIIDREQGGGE